MVQHLVSRTALTSAKNRQAVVDNEQDICTKDNLAIPRKDDMTDLGRTRLNLSFILLSMYSGISVYTCHNTVLATQYPYRSTIFNAAKDQHEPLLPVY